MVSAGLAVDRYGPWVRCALHDLHRVVPAPRGQQRPFAIVDGVDAQVGYEIAPKTKLRLDVFNLFDAQTSDITYYYASRLPGEPPEGVNDIHFHPGEKRSFRVSLSYRF